MEPVGLNPFTAVNLLEEQYWFHGDLSDEKSKRLLTNVGDFLVRRNPKDKKYVASVVWTDQNRYNIGLSDVGWSPEGQSFSEIQSLVKNLCDHSKFKTPIIRKEWQLRNDDISYNPSDEIGRGHFANVYKARYKNEDVAVKIYREITTAKQRKDFFLEGFMLGQNWHRNIIRFIGFATDRDPMMIVTEYVEGGDLHSYLIENKDNLRLKELLSMCKDVATGMAYLERKKLFHRDLAARNCLVKPIGRRETLVKISDFGMSRLAKHCNLFDSDVLPLRWTALEVLNGEPHTSKSDVWSFGILMWEIFSKGITPYNGKRNASLKEALNHGFRMTAPTATPPKCDKLMQKCWMSNPDERYDFVKIKAKLKRYHRMFS